MTQPTTSGEREAIARMIERIEETALIALTPADQGDMAGRDGGAG